MEDVRDAEEGGLPYPTIIKDSWSSAPVQQDFLGLCPQRDKKKTDKEKY